jgi:hypothetical protein
LCHEKGFTHYLELYQLSPPASTTDGHLAFWAGLCGVTKQFVSRVCNGWMVDDTEQYLELGTAGEDNMRIPPCDAEDDDGDY